MKPGNPLDASSGVRGPLRPARARAALAAGAEDGATILADRKATKP